VKIDGGGGDSARVESVRRVLASARPSGTPQRESATGRVAALREKQTDLARAQLTALVAKLPHNPLFVDELAELLDKTQP